MEKKPSLRPDFGPFDPNSGHQFSSFKNLASSVTRYHDELTCTISETNDPFLRKPSDGQRVRRTDGRE